MDNSLPGVQPGQCSKNSNLREELSICRVELCLGGAYLLFSFIVVVVVTFLLIYFGLDIFIKKSPKQRR